MMASLSRDSLIPAHVLWVLLVCAPAFASDPDLSALEAKFARIIASGPSGRAAGGEVGVALIHIESGSRLSIHGDRRFPMASVYKLPLAIELLTQVSQGSLALTQPVTIRVNDIRACCTLSRKYPKGGVTMTAGELLELLMVYSDNTACDLLMKLVGGPAVVERRMRMLGFAAINVNRYEGEIALEMTGVRQRLSEADWTLELERRLISEVPADELRAARARYTSDARDTSTPDDMALLLARLQKGDLLPRAYTDLLLDLLTRAKTGPARLKALLPIETQVAHKTGTTEVVINDVGIITLPETGATRGHLVLAVFVMNGARVTQMQQTIAQIAGAAFESFTGKPLPAKPKPKPAHKKRGRRR